MDHAWLDSLSEDWVSQPRSGSPIHELPSFHNSVSESNSRIASTKIPKYNPQKQAWVAEDGGNSPLSERSLNNHNLPLSQHGTSRSPTKLRQVTNGSGRGRRISRTLSASSTQSVQHNTVQHKSRSLSPKKGIQDTPEWKKRLLQGEVAYGEQRDLFSPAGLENLFKPPAPAVLPNRKSPMRIVEEDSVMPSSPPPYNVYPASVDEEESSGEHSVHVTKGEQSQPHGMKYKMTNPASSMFSAGSISRSSSFQPAISSQSTNRQALESSTGPDCDSSLTQDAANNDPGRTVSGQSVLRNEELSPIYVARHNTIDGKIDYAALPADELKRRLENIQEISFKSIENQENSSAGLQDDVTAATEDFARNGGFVNSRRGGRSEEGSFQKRMLSPSSLPPIDESLLLSEISMQASTPKPLPNITKTRASNEYRMPPPSDQSLAVPPAPHPSPVKFTDKHSNPSSGSPLKLFGTYDTFTNQKLLRRLSQFEGALDEVDKNESSAVSGYESTHPGIDEAFVAPSSPEKVSQRSYKHQHAPQKVSNFGKGDLDEFEFSEEASYDSTRTNPYEDDKENNVLPVLDPRVHTSFKFDLDPSVLESNVVVRRRAKYMTTTSMTKHVVTSQDDVRPMTGESDNSSRLPNSQIQEDLHTPRRRNGDSEGKRMLRSPPKDPTPKRRRTLQQTELQQLGKNDGDYEIDSINETHQRMQSVVGKKRKDARHGDDHQAANPKVLAMRQILRPRTPTPSQRGSHNQERQPLQELEVETVDREIMAQNKKLAQIQAELDADTLQMSGFRLSLPMADDSRKGSVTTQDFLDEAKKIMAGIRNKTQPRSGLTSVEESESENDKNRAAEVTSPEPDLEETYEDSTQEPFSRPPSREGGGILPRLPKQQEDPALLDHLRKYEEKSDIDGMVASSMRSIAMAKEAAQAAKETDRLVEGVISKSSARLSLRDNNIESDPPNMRISHNPDANRKRKHSTSSVPSASGVTHEDDFPSNGSSGSSNLSTSRSIPTGSSRNSDSRRVILPNTVSHLIPEQLAGMVFDKERNIWIKRKTVSGDSMGRNFLPSDETEDDPFGDIPDLSVDETQELLRIKAVAKRKERERAAQEHESQQNMACEARSGENNNASSLHLSTTTKSKSINSQATHGLSRPGPQGTPQPRADPSETKSVNSKSVLERVESRRTETRKEVIEEVEREISILEDRVITPPKRRNVTISFSSPIASIIQTDYQDEQIFEQQDADESEQSEDDYVKGRSANGKARNFQQTPSGQSRKQFRNTSRNVSLVGHQFSVRPVSRIDEQDEESMLEENNQFKRSVSILVTAPAVPSAARQTSMVVSTPRPTRQPGSLSLTPLSAFTVHQTDESLGLEVSYVEQNQRHTVGEGTQKALSLSIKDLVEKITEVEPYEPFWEQLKQIELKDKRLTNLHKLDEFCEQLEELNVSRNQITHLGGVPRTVRNLNIAHNRLSDLSSWAHLSNLQYVDVSNNDLDSLSAFRGLIHMRSLRADNNRISSLHGIDQLDGLLNLRMRNNSIGELDFRGTKLQRLTDLDVQGNQVSRVDGLHDLRSLSTLNLTNNCLSEWTVLKSEELPAMKYLRLSGNTIQSIDIGQYPNLRLLYIDGNRLGNVLGLCKTKYLDSLSMREQQQDSVVDHKFLSEAYEVRKLFLSGNLLKTFEPQHNFLNLQYLELANCGLESLPSYFGSMMANIRVLNLNSNALKDISPLAGIVRLKKLHLAGNRLDTVKHITEMITNFKSLSIADLRGNPLTLGFYPPIMESRVVVRGESEEEHIVEEPYTLASADQAKDARYQRCLDLETRIQRRLFEMLVIPPCKRLRLLDGLPVDRLATFERKDKVFVELAARGYIVTPDGVEIEDLVEEDEEQAVEELSERWAGENSFA